MSSEQEFYKSVPDQKQIYISQEKLVLDIHTFAEQEMEEVRPHHHHHHHHRQ